MGRRNQSDHKSTSSTQTWTHQTHRTQICHITVTHLRLISDACVFKMNACVRYLNACVQCLDACVTYFWDAWVFALILDVPDSLKIENSISTSTPEGTIFIVILELTNMHAFPDHSTSLLSHNKLWRYLQEIRTSKFNFNRKHNYDVLLKWH